MYRSLASMKSWRCQGAGHPPESEEAVLYRKHLMNS